MLYRYYLALIAAVTMVAGVACAADSSKLSLQWPLVCSLGKDCFIGAYPDVTAGTDPSKPSDYRCGHRTLPGLQDTHVFFKDWQSGLDGQRVYPVAAGKVALVVDNFVDGDIRNGEEVCGNSVVVDHDGWQSRYCHLRQGSVEVKAGQEISTRDVLAEVGQSGGAVEPMLAFMITKDGVPYDPFLGATIDKGAGCNKTAEGDWNSPMNYLDAAIVSTGFAPRVVNHLEVKASSVIPERDLNHHSPYLVSWARVQHIRGGDEEVFTLTSPDNKVMEERRTKLPGDSEDYLTYVFAKAGKEGLMPGEWSSHYELKRGGRIILQKNNSFTLE